MLRALLLGIALPMLLYWLYTRCPIVGGREYGWSSSMRPRFIVKLCLLGLLMLWLPARIIRRHLQQRCADLGITLPSPREERRMNWLVRGAGVAALLLLMAAIKFTTHLLDVTTLQGLPYAANVSRPSTTWGQYLLTDTLVLAIGIGFAMLLVAMWKRRQHALYYGTLARSLAPVYAFAILFLTLVVQPWLLYNEAHWLHQRHRDSRLSGEQPRDQRRVNHAGNEKGATSDGDGVDGNERAGREAVRAADS